jgi:RNA polymerase sigma-70 factor (ECF subfamily)
MTLTEKSDVELVREFKAGTAGAFDAIVLRFQNRVYRLACVWLYDTQNADDATQEVFLRAHKGLRRFAFRAAPFTWLYRTTRYVCNEFNRRRKTEALDEEPLDNRSSPDRHVAEHDTAARVRLLVAGLPERQRDVVLLRIFEELSVADTAKAMGCREGTIKALLHKATKRLRLDIEKTGLQL